MSTLSLPLCWEIKKKFCGYPVLSVAMNYCLSLIGQLLYLDILVLNVLAFFQEDAYEDPDEQPRAPNSIPPQRRKASSPVQVEVKTKSNNKDLKGTRYTW